ncbi:MAG: tRNA pseudouridine(13) synthase TruD [Haliea sp.]|nr:tRNA pseudouridine(13) synthase TruD [Haliea sp.]
MSLDLPRCGPLARASAVIRTLPGDFVVHEQLGFEPDGQGEHVFLHLEKTGLTTPDLLERVSALAGIPLRDIGYSGLKDRHAVTRQWVSVRMAGKPEPDWQRLNVPGEVELLVSQRHSRKLKRGVHRANTFALCLRQLEGDPATILGALQRIRDRGVPNYFAEQRFGRGGATLLQARHWMERGARKLTHSKRGFFLSALRSDLFNRLLAQRVLSGAWERLQDGDVCMLHGSRSVFPCSVLDADLQARAAAGDVHPGLPLWGVGVSLQSPAVEAAQRALLLPDATVCTFLEQCGLALSYRSARLLPDDFSWHFCDDASLLLTFSLPPGSYATALLAELLDYREGYQEREGRSE